MFTCGDTQLVRLKMPSFSVLSRCSCGTGLLTRCMTVENLRSKEGSPRLLSYQCIVELAETTDSWEKKVPQTFCFGHFLFKELTEKNTSNKSYQKNKIWLDAHFASYCLTYCPIYLMPFFNSCFQQVQSLTQSSDIYTLHRTHFCFPPLLFVCLTSLHTLPFLTLFLILFLSMRRSFSSSIHQTYVPCQCLFLLLLVLKDIYYPIPSVSQRVVVSSIFPQYFHVQNSISLFPQRNN